MRRRRRLALAVAVLAGYIGSYLAGLHHNTETVEALAKVEDERRHSWGLTVLLEELKYCKMKPYTCRTIQYVNVCPETKAFKQGWQLGYSEGRGDK